MNPLSVKKSGMPIAVTGSHAPLACPNAIVNAAMKRSPVSALRLSRATVMTLSAADHVPFRYDQAPPPFNTSGDIAAFRKRRQLRHPGLPVANVTIGG